MPGHPYIAYAVDDELASTSPEIAAAVAQILASRYQPQVGDRVRVRVDVECLYCVDDRYPACSADAVANDGRTATVVSVDPGTPHDPTGCFCSSFQPDAVDEDADSMAARHAHRYWVAYDERMPHDGPELDGVDFDQHFAAAELELLP